MLIWLSIEKVHMNLLGILLISARPTGGFQGSMTLFLSIFFLISVGLIVCGIVLYKKRAIWIQKSITTYGHIVEISKRYARDDHSGRFPIYFPIVAYQVNGLEFRREAETGLVKNCEIGQEIPVRYLSENPYEASLSDKNVPVLNPTVFFVLVFKISVTPKKRGVSPSIIEEFGEIETSQSVNAYKASNVLSGETPGVK